MTHHDQTFRLLIVGPPGAGKGTQAVGIAEAFGIPAISTGDIFRANIKNGTNLGIQVREIIESGNLVPDSLTNELVRDRLTEADAAGGFLLDGYPRTLNQVRTLDDLLAVAGERLDAVICLRADEEELVQRLLRRGLEQGRTDDTEGTIRTRLAVYRQQTAPLDEEYRRRGLLAEVDGLGPVDVVTGRIHRALTALTR